ncbi:transglutaminase domain-containing protein [Granulicella tundricola MP5ACTX9]|uniref:Transglutaminase domain-containing protein n=2 Tax=Granulicella TaxID=940557 RepID=E8X1E0_GRATM|nr:transglutaminase domain-containing protein [Granulicella tundricola MP5ACTX9]
MSLCSFPSELFCRVLLVATLSLCTVPAFASRDSVPDWVAAAAAKPMATYSAETSAVVLLDDTTLTVGADGKGVEHRRHVVKILRPNGRDEGVVWIPYDKDTKILSLHVWSIAPDGKQYAVKDNEMVDVGYPGQGSLYEDIKMRAVRAPGRDPGGVIAYEYDQRKEPYLHEETWMFQQEIPVANQSFTLELPPGYTYGTVWAHHDQQKAADLEHQRYRWEMNATPGIDLDRVPMHPSELALAGRMTVHYAPVGTSADSLATWRGIGEWYEPLMRDRVLSTPEIAAKAAALTSGKTDFYDKTEAIGDYVQAQIRYFVIEMGIGGQQPHPAADIFRNGYGDCKDKATLLSAMLSSVGVHSTLMAVDHRRGVVDPLAPSIFGDHMIAAIEIPKGYESAKLRSVITAKTGKRYLIFDPTWDKTAFGQLEYNLQGGYGVLFEGKDTEIVELPVLSPELNSVKRSGTFQLAVDGTLKGSLTEKRYGDVSERMRSLYTESDAKQQRSFLDESLSHDFTTVDVEDVKVENAASLSKELTTSYELTAGRYSRSMGPLLMVRPRVLGTEGLPVDRKVRLVPIDLRGTRLIHDDFTIELPDGFAVDELPEPVKLDMGFASYESSSQLTGKTLHYSRTYTVKQVSLPADRYGDLQKLALAIENDEQNHAVLKKK